MGLLIDVNSMPDESKSLNVSTQLAGYKDSIAYDDALKTDIGVALLDIPLI